MRQRKDIDYGKDQTPAQIWADWVTETRDLLARTLPPEVLRQARAAPREPVPAQ